MSDYRLIAFDMDGTLLDSQKRIPQETLVWIDRAVQAGKIVALSTGRNPAELSGYVDELPQVQYAISVSGGLVREFHTGKTLHSAALRDSDVRAIMKAAEGIDVMIYLMSDLSVAEGRCAARMAHYNMGIYQSMYDRIITPVEDIRAWYDEHPVPPNKLNLYFHSLEDRVRVQEKLRPFGITLTWSEIASLECTPSGVNKGTGLAALCDALGIPISQAIAVGDADNDVEIIRAAGLGVAMGNANDTVKACADVVVADNDHGGCVEAIKTYLLGL